MIIFHFSSGNCRYLALGLSARATHESGTRNTKLLATVDVLLHENVVF
jgi:hypothetical protein